MTKLQNKVVWITGASSGIGEALVYQLSKEKANLIISARRKRELGRVKNSCHSEWQKNIHILPFDLSKTDSLKLMSEAAINYYGRIDILINNGGVSQRSLAKETLMEVDRQIMEVNYF
ncbi:MAG: SDR family NAD(P)-dependent oxidoreductase, partial [Bacteroidetes bacterium]|nr:SDR family NAD(P)-dependent oxidoreductase [Bacteroidota bacterium]